MSLLDHLDLTEITLVVHDWGGPIGLGTLATVAGPLRPGGGVEHRPAHLGPRARGQLTWANHATGEGRVVLEESLVDYVQYCHRAPELVASTFLYSPPRGHYRRRCSAPTTLPSPIGPSPRAYAR